VTVWCHAEILFLATFDKMGFDQKQLREPSKPLYGFGGKRTELVGTITLPVSFGTPKNPRTEYITFEVVDMAYPYNTIFERGLLTTLSLSGAPPSPASPMVITPDCWLSPVIREGDHGSL
jgi:hypothetical protein